MQYRTTNMRPCAKQAQCAPWSTMTYTAGAVKRYAVKLLPLPDLPPSSETLWAGRKRIAHRVRLD
jgi:hypothetical protein